MADSNAISHVSVGVADMAPVRTLWTDRFGLEVVAERPGPDAGLAELWGIAAEQIAHQLLLRTPGADSGQLHFVQFDDPNPPIRLGAAATDLGPKNLDVTCVDMPQRYQEMRAAGYRFRSGISDYEVGDLRVREVQMPGHDETNIVFVEVLSDGWDVKYSPAGYAAITSLVVIVPDNRAEADFYSSVFGLDEIMHHRITGPGIEKVVGLPHGAALDMRLMGRAANFFGRMELITYEGLTGTDRFALAKPPALGSLHCGFAAESVPDFLDRARRAGHEAEAFGHVDTIFGTGPMAVLRSPAGLHIEIYQKA